MAKICVGFATPKNNHSPVILNFENGYTTDFKRKPCVLLENTKDLSRTVAMEMDGLLYSGSSNESNTNREKTVLLVKNKFTGKVRILEVDDITMKPISTVHHEEANLLETERADLKKKFGTKKQKKLMEQREKQKVNTETVQQQIQNVTQNISEDQLDLSSYNRNDSNDFYIPPIDRDAKKVEDVYDVEKILTKTEYDQIYLEMQEVDYMEQLHPLLHTVISGKTLSPVKAVLTVYASTLLKLTQLPARDTGKKTFQACPYSETLNKHILDNFTVMVNSKRYRPITYKDKALCHAIVFLLLLGNFKFELDDFCKAMKLAPNTMATKIRSIGASVTSSSGKKYVQLKFPLNKGTSLVRRSAKFK